MHPIGKGCPHHIIAALLAIILLMTGATPAQSDPPKSSGQTLYVPVYSHIYSGDRERPLYLAVTISIRNTDPNQAIRLTRVDYFDSEGKLLRGYLEKPTVLGPMASTRYIVGESDKAGGSGANFIVRWEADTPVSPPITEGIMISTASQLGISFTSPGQVIPD
ncbi:MAG: DUF3124 domain-containing protein [Desulfobacterales bacterium]|nr:DUF3124 domain-containing protein [Desulfobacterales bacterium]MDJ0874304.1 DUF3124 domain-containing protein [Desulfobacterales bacterium]MDJ0882949.1 DUF3124 domain-containing protein [Desulfobacterales bacterium]